LENLQRYITTNSVIFAGNLMLNFIIKDVAMLNSVTVTVDTRNAYRTVMGNATHRKPEKEKGGLYLNKCLLILILQLCIIQNRTILYVSIMKI
jgi:hypothetical protein